MKMVYVQWDDSCSEDTWQAPASTYRPVHCETVGFLVERKKGSVTIASSKSEHGMVCNLITIPMSVVTKIRAVK